MIRKIIFDKTTLPHLSRGLDALHARQKAIAQNIANVQTPGYHRQVVLFEEELKKSLHRAGEGRLMETNPQHLPGRLADRPVRAQTVDADDRRDGPGSEELVIEREMSLLAQTQILYETEAKLAQNQFEMLKMAIRGSR
jgi:flagellar basal-body rod protein FlgB